MRAGAVALLLVAIGPGAAAVQDGERRLTPDEAMALPVVPAGPGTSRLGAIETRLLSGDPAADGLYTIAIRVPPDTRIAAHTHRDDRTAVVVQGVWHFGYGTTASTAASRALPAGSFYTEPADAAHFAWTGPEGATVYITGHGPTDTRYVEAGNDPAAHRTGKP